ncbi:MAG: 3-oxoacyl-ACP synthase III family protein [Myxococcota bacterium]
MIPVSLRAIASAFPSDVVTNDFFGDGSDAPQSGMFRGAKQRHHMAPGQTAVDLIMSATADIEAQLDRRIAQDIDIILTNVSMPDLPFTGCGAEVAKAIGARPQSVYDLHNHGCVSFISMMALARSLMSTSGARSALICNVQTAAGRIFSDPEVRKNPQAAVPGDGCGVALLVAGEERPIEAMAVKCFSEYASDMQISSPDGRQWWEPGQRQFHIDFSRSKIAKIVQRGNRLVPEMVQQVCAEAGIAAQDAGALITNQPNPVFLRNWREALQVPAERHVDTFAEHGNLFGAGIPVCLDRARTEGKLGDGSYVILGGFSHAGDYAGAAVIRWKAEA